MAKSNLQGINTSDGAIGIELNEQEELILKANNIVIACRQAISHISGAITALPDVSSEGIFKQYISKDWQVFSTNMQLILIRNLLIWTIFRRYKLPILF